MTPRIALLAALAFSGLAIYAAQPPASRAADITSDVTQVDGAGMVMKHTFTTTAPVERVWRAIASADGLASWAAPAARVELRIGGSYELYFRPDNPPGKRGMEGNKVLSFAPLRMISYSGGLPDTWVVYIIEPHVGGTRVTFAAMGTNPEWEAKCSEQSGAVAVFVQKLADVLKK